MTVAEETPYRSYTANGTANSFPIVFNYPSAASLVVRINGVMTSAYTITSGSVVFNTTPAMGAFVEIIRKTPLARQTNYGSFNNSFKPSTLNADFDALWLALQDKSYLIDEAVTDLGGAIEQLGTTILTASNALASANNAQSAAGNAVTTANNASGQSAQAISAANTAASNASTALNVANSIDTKATTALSNSETALSTANGVDGKATTALSNANAALSTANGIAGTANSALSTANSALGIVNSIVPTANAATSTANSALSTANGIAATANNALSTANTANTNASTALSTANNISGTASTALSTANAASAAASTATSTANSAQSAASTATTNANKALQERLRQTYFSYPWVNGAAEQALASGLFAASLRQITIDLVSVSTVGTSPLIIQIGSGGAYLTTGYQAICTAFSGTGAQTTSSTLGFNLTGAVAATTFITGRIVLTRDSLSGTLNRWTLTAQLIDTATGTTQIVATGTVSLNAVIDRLRLTTAGGGAGNNFDSGTMTITFQYQDTSAT